MTPPYITELVERLAEAAYVARFEGQKVTAWADQPDEVRAVWRKVAAAVLRSFANINAPPAGGTTTEKIVTTLG